MAYFCREKQEGTCNSNSNICVYNCKHHDKWYTHQATFHLFSHTKSFDLLTSCKLHKLCDNDGSTKRDTKTFCEGVMWVKHRFVKHKVNMNYLRSLVTSFLKQNLRQTLFILKIPIQIILRRESLLCMRDILFHLHRVLQSKILKNASLEFCIPH